MNPLLQSILEHIEAKHPAHAARLKPWVESNDSIYETRAAEFFSRYQACAQQLGRTLFEGVDCYLQLCAHMVRERMEFLRSGRYANQSFAEVEKHIYLNPEVFEYHMHGLVFAQFFWPEQYARFRLFSERIGRNLKSGDRYLEIGGGHALYILEAIRRASSEVNFQLVDISPSSMKLARGMTEGLKIDFRLQNIFDFAPAEKFNFITMGEVLEHVEDPLSLLHKLRGLLVPDGKAFISTPANAPTIDHIYLFNDADEIRAMLRKAGFEILVEKVEFAQNVNEAKARQLKIAEMFAAFVQPR